MIVSSQDYQQRNGDKVEYVKETLYELILYEDESQGGYSYKEKEVMMKLNMKFEMHDLML